MNIRNKMRAPGHSTYYSEEWKNLVDQHIDFLLSSSNSIVADVEPMAAHKYAGDLAGFLVATQVPAHFTYVVLKLNGLTDGTQFNDSIKQLILPSEKDLEKLMGIFTTVYS
jgi:hypothetical protein